MTKRIVLGIVALLAVAGLGWLIYRAVQPTPLGETAVVRRGRIEARVDALGTVQLARQTQVVAAVGGTVGTVAVQPGDEVSADALLVELDSPDLREALLQAQSALELRLAELDGALAAPDQASIDLAVARLRRATALRQKAQADYDAIREQPDTESSDEALALAEAKLEYEVAQSDYDRTMRGASELELDRLRVYVEEARRALTRAETRLEQVRVLAPFDGVVLGVSVEVGAPVFVGSALCQLGDPGRLEVRAEVSELDVAQVAAGQQVRMWLDAFPGVQLDGSIIRVLPAPSTARGMTAYVALIELQNSALELRPGMGANVQIITGVEEETLLVPRRAVRTVGFDRVVRVLEGRQVTDVVVITGLSNGDETQVLTGLREGQQVLIN